MSPGKDETRVCEYIYIYCLDIYNTLSHREGNSVLVVKVQFFKSKTEESNMILWVHPDENQLFV